MSRVGLARFFFRTLSVTQDLSQRATTGSCSGVRMEDAYSNGKTLWPKPTFMHHVACNCGSEMDPDNMIVAQTCARRAALCGMEVSGMRISSMKP